MWGGGVVFDFDGVVADTEAPVAEALLALIADRGGRTSLAEVSPLFGGADDESYRRWERYLARTLGPDVDPADVDAELARRTADVAGRCGPMPGVGPTLTRLRADGWALGVATNRSRASTLSILRRWGMDGAIDVVVGGDEVAAGKPAPDLYRAAVARLDRAPQRCVAVEDTEEGCRAARAAGLAVVLCETPLTAGRPTPDGVTRIAGLRELPAAVERLGLSARSSSASAAPA